jgi:hypothetical protein
VNKAQAAREARALAAEWIWQIRQTDDSGWRECYEDADAGLVAAEILRLQADLAESGPSLFHLRPDDLPIRVAAAVHALMEASAEGGPVTTAEVCELDADALRPEDTSAALSAARNRGLAVGAHGYWSATRAAWKMRRELEDLVTGDKSR